MTKQHLKIKMTIKKDKKAANLNFGHSPFSSKLHPLLKKKKNRPFSINKEESLAQISTLIADLPSKIKPTDLIKSPPVLSSLIANNINFQHPDHLDSKSSALCFQLLSQVEKNSIRVKTFDQLTAFEIYNILKLRQNIFILEKKIMYDDIDDKDFQSIHVWHQNKVNNNFLAYLRIVPMNDIAHISIGRVLTTPEARKQGLARQLMKIGIELARTHYPTYLLKLSAKEELCPFYETLGFEKTDPVFFYPKNDPTPIIPMIYKENSRAQIS